MTELETQLLAAFEQLSMQYESEQKRQAALIEALSQQLQLLSKQVSGSAQRVQTLAGHVMTLAGALSSLNDRLTEFAGP